MPGAPLLSLRGVSKAFAGVQALEDVDLELKASEVHALVGENGAGKSTLMKILFGVVHPDAGDIVIDGNGNGNGKTTITNPRHALAMGIGLVSQELSLVPQLDVAQNIFLGQAGAFSLARRGELRARAAEILKHLAPDLPVTARVASLGMAERQVVEIARTLARGGRIIAFDEPTSSLTPSERDGLFALIRNLKHQGKAIVYISHRMPEIYAIADRITVLRDGRTIASGAPGSFHEDELNDLIAGRKLAQALHQPRRSAPAPSGADALRLKGIATEKLVDVDLTLHGGEIFGLAGLVGSGRTELARCIFGADPKQAGRILVNDRPVDVRSPADARAAGIALIPEDRRGHALVPLMNVGQNFGLANYERYARFGILRGRLRRKDATRYIDELAIRPRRVGSQVRNLSGGNQQKVVIARWLRSGARVFLFDEPTRGIDVGAKAEIHGVLRRLAGDGCAVLVISSELPELLTLADRIGIMREGRLVATIDNNAELTEDRLMRHAVGEAAQ